MLAGLQLENASADLETLAARHFPGGIVQPGQRDLYGFLGICHLAHVVPADTLWREAPPGRGSCCPLATSAIEDTHRHARAALDRATRAAAGETVAIGRRRITPCYTHSTARMIDLLGVTPDDMRQMHTLIDPPEKARRRREREGRMERAEYEGRASERRRAVAAALKAGTAPAQLAADHGISLRHVYRLAQAAGDEK